MKIKLLALAAITLLTIGSAQAKFNSGESHDPAGEYAKFAVSPGNHDDYYDYYNEFFEFKLDQVSSLEVTVEVLNTSGGNLLDNNLFLVSEDTDEGAGYLSFGTGTSTAHFDNLAAGSYFYTLYGYNNGTGDSEVSLSSTFTNAVPEPETYALMLGGLGVIGFLARRRKTL